MEGRALRDRVVVFLALGYNSRGGCEESTHKSQGRCTLHRVRRHTTTPMRIGIGHDTHRLAEGGPLRLGGVEIPCSRHLVGHSDADVLLHAVTDALLGATASGDIGEMFPNTDETHRNRDSAEMLAEAYALVVSQGFRAINLDCIVFAERPKLSPFKEQIRQRIAEILGLPAGDVSVKAKTGEQVGAVGRQEAVMAQCVVLLERT